MYKHALVLISNETDGRFLLQGVAKNFYQLGTKITLGHITADYRELDIASDAFMKDSESTEIIVAKAMLSRLVETTDFPITVKEIVTMRQFEDITTYIERGGIDLLIMGHKNRFFGSLCAYSNEFINRLPIEVLITHIDI